LIDRLEKAARAAREAAETATTEPERQALMNAARRYQIAAHLDKWLASPRLPPLT
jgi:hypothetical protein